MLTIRAARSPGYYERREFAIDDYYAERGEAVGVWVGRGSEGLGLKGAPADGDLGRLLDGEHPISSVRLEGLRNGRRNVGFDRTWTAPKSVSVLLSVGDEHLRGEVLAAQEAGVRAGLDYLERFECQARRGAGGVRIVSGGGFAGAMYHHELSRAGDPHLHTHAVITNAVQGSDGRWSAPDMRPVFAAAKTAGTIAEATMRDELTRRLGVEWGPVRNGTAELAAVPERVLLEFSTRRSEIVELALARGAESIQAVGAVQRETRDHKPVLDRDLAVDGWRARAAEHGLGRLEITGLLYQRHPYQFTSAEHVVLAERLAGPTGLTERVSTFDGRAVLRAYAEAHQQGVTLPEIECLADRWIAERAIQIQPEIAEVGRRASWTTPDMIDSERRLLDLSMRRDRGVQAPPEAIERVLASRPEVGPDQAAAVAHLAGSGDPVRVMVARAGTGKTYTLGLVRQAFERSGIDVAGCSWQGEAAQIMERDAAIPARTIAGLLSRAERDGSLGLPPGSVLVVDEAGTVPTRALTRLMEHATAGEVTVLLVGDPRQIPSIESGGALASLAARLGAVELTENRRQQLELHQQVAARLADQRPRDALELLVEHDRVHAHPSRDHALDALTARWARESLPDVSRSLILAHDRADVTDLNRRARLQMDRAGLLGQERLAAAGREWAAGDRLVYRRNDYRLEVDVRNGTRATVTGIDLDAGSLAVRTDDGRHVQLPPDYLEHAHHGYAITGHISQGATTDRTYLFATPERAGMEWGYVAASRHRHDLHVYTVGFDVESAAGALAHGWDRSQAKHLAIDQLQAAPHATPTPEIPFTIGGPLPSRQPTQTVSTDPAVEMAPARGGGAPEDAALATNLAMLRAERDKLTPAVGTYPTAAVEQIRRLGQEAQAAEQRALSHEYRAQHAQARLNELPAWKISGRRALQQEIGDHYGQAGTERDLAETLTRKAHGIEYGPGGPTSWEERHPGLRERHRSLGIEIHGLESSTRAPEIEFPSPGMRRIRGPSIEPPSLGF